MIFLKLLLPSYLIITTVLSQNSQLKYEISDSLLVENPGDYLDDIRNIRSGKQLVFIHDESSNIILVWNPRKGITDTLKFDHVTEDNVLYIRQFYPFSDSLLIFNTLHQKDYLLSYDLINRRLQYYPFPKKLSYNKKDLTYMPDFTKFYRLNDSIAIVSTIDPIDITEKLWKKSHDTLCLFVKLNLVTGQFSSLVTIDGLYQNLGYPDWFIRKSFFGGYVRNNIFYLYNVHSRNIWQVDANGNTSLLHFDKSELSSIPIIKPIDPNSFCFKLTQNYYFVHKDLVFKLETNRNEIYPYVHVKYGLVSEDLRGISEIISDDFATISTTENFIPRPLVGEMHRKYLPYRWIDKNLQYKKLYLYKYQISFVQ